MLLLLPLALASCEKYYPLEDDVTRGGEEGDSTKNSSTNIYITGPEWEGERTYTY